MAQDLAPTPVIRNLPCIVTVTVRKAYTTNGNISHCWGGVGFRILGGRIRGTRNTVSCQQLRYCLATWFAGNG